MSLQAGIIMKLLEENEDDESDDEDEPEPGTYI